MLTLESPDAQAETSAPRPRHCEIAEPWKRSWFYCAPGETPTLLWIVGLHLALVLGVILIPLSGRSLWPGWPVALATLVLTMLGALGTTVGFHRALTHRAVRLHPVVEHTLTFFATLSGSGTPLSWVGNHRLHHATSDTQEDVSSPTQGGFSWAHLRWIWQVGRAPLLKYCPDLDKPVYHFWSAIQFPIFALSISGGLLLGWSAWLWLGPIRMLWALHVQCSVNSICHLGDPAASGGSSRNVWWLAPFHFLQGENWHRNHHEEPTDARLGRSAAQVDVGWWTIALLERLGLASRIRRPLEERARRAERGRPAA